MQAYEEEEAGEVASEVEQMTVVVEPAVGASRVSNWRYFWAGESVRGRESGGPGVRQGEVDVESGEVRTGRGWRFWRRGT